MSIADSTVNAARDDGPRIPGMAYIERHGENIDSVLVKEVRQALSSKLFDIGFLLLQGIMGLVLLVNAVDPDPGSGGLLFTLGTLFCVAFPMRAQYSVYDDFKQANIELVQLTRTTGWRLIIGKITAQLVVMLVFAVSVLPWFTARYFTGGVDISSELAIFGLLLVIGTYATMVSCVIAVFNNLLLRIAATIATLWLGIAIAGGIAFGGFLHSYGGGKGPGAIWIDMAMLATTLAFFLPSVIQLMLIAAARINLVGEFYELAIRLWSALAIVAVPLGALAIYGIHVWSSGGYNMDKDFAWPALIAGCSGIVALTLHVSQLRDVVFPRLVRAWAGWFAPLRLGARLLLAPTWSSGLLMASLAALSVLAGILAAMNCHQYSMGSNWKDVGYALTFVAMFNQTALLATLLTLATRQRLTILMSLVIIAILEISITIAIGNLVPRSMYAMGYWLPAGGALAIDHREQASVFALVQSLWCGFALVVALVGCVRHNAAIAAAEKIAREQGGRSDGDTAVTHASSEG